MKRRSFVKASLITGLLSHIISSKTFAAGMNNENTPQEFYELRVYALKNDTQQKMVENYFEHAAIAAYNRLGCKNIGIFTEKDAVVQTKLFVLIPFKSMVDFVSVQDKLIMDTVYNEQAKTYLNAPATEPAYERMESSFLRGFAHMPKMEVPEHKTRMFELRCYQSASESAAKKKIEMFNSQGEIDIFKKDGLRPVFFGETLIGPLMPNLTYMLCFDDMAAHDRTWKAFGTDPEWKKISSVPEYADAKIVSHITATFLIPATYSQV